MTSSFRRVRHAIHTVAADHDIEVATIPIRGGRVRDYYGYDIRAERDAVARIFDATMARAKRETAGG